MQDPFQLRLYPFNSLVDQPRKKAFRVVFVGLACLLLGYAALFGLTLHAQHAPVLVSKTIWAAVACAVFFALAAWRFPKNAQRAVLGLLVTSALVEALLQIVGWLGLLPGVITKEKAPFARVYWTAEGRGNSVRNRFGWHAPKFDLQAPQRIALIGDSFVEAVEVSRDHTTAVMLQQLLCARWPQRAVFALGTHGTSPAFYIEVLDYAKRHFAPQEAIVFLYLGNDISESSPALNYVPPEHYIYYEMDHNGQLALLPASAGHREQFINSMEQCHRPLWMHLSVIVKSHCMLAQSLLSLKSGIERARRLRLIVNAKSEDADLDQIGRNLRPFALTPDPEARRAMELMLAELGLMQHRCHEHGIKLRLVTIPYFPPQFYTAQQGSHWTLRLGEYDFLIPDREIAAFARSHGIPLLSLADWLANKKMGVEEIRSLYFLNGTGHFTERGHRTCAQAVFETFYSIQE